MGQFSREQRAEKERKKASAKKKKTGRTYIITCLLIAVAIAIPAAIFTINYIQIRADRYLVESELTINEVDTTYISDGEYFAAYHTGKMSATVGVTLADGRMTKISVYDYENITIDSAKQLFDDVIKYQMLNTPDFLERTYSEKVLLKAVETALTNRSEQL